jgi:hypothetical protein
VGLYDPAVAGGALRGPFCGGDGVLCDCAEALVAVLGNTAQDREGLGGVHPMPPHERPDSLTRRHYGNRWA